MAELLGNRLFTALDADGAPISGAKLYFYLTGTTTLVDVYEDSLLTTPHASPVVCDSAGRAADIYFDNSISHKLVIKDADGITIRTIDPFNGISGTGQASALSYGIVCDWDGDSGTYNATALAAAFADLDPGAELFLPGDAYIGTSRVENPNGVVITGPGKLVYAEGSDDYRVQNHQGYHAPIRGSERLAVFQDKWRRRVACTIRVSGDSKAGTSGPDLAVIMARYPWVTVTTASQSGKTLTDWVDTYLADDITAAPDILVLDWGTNIDASNATTGAKLFEGLETYRASVATKGIVLVCPPAASDGANSRDEQRIEAIHPYFREACDTFNTALVDIYSMFPDAYFNNSANLWLDSAHVHPAEIFRNAYAGAIFDAILPPTLRTMWETGVFNIPSSLGNAARNPALTDAPTTYFDGIQIHRATTANSWTNDGFVLTIKHADAESPIQFNWSYGSGLTDLIVRTYTNGVGWNAWLPAVSIMPTAAKADTAALSTYTRGWNSSRAASGSAWPFDGWAITMRDPVLGTQGIQFGFNYGNDGLIYARTYTTNDAWGDWQTIGSLLGSTTYDAASIADGAYLSTTVTVTGAALGDFAVASFGVSTAGLVIGATVTATDTVTVTMFNKTGGAIDLASTTLRARVFKA